VLLTDDKVLISGGEPAQGSRAADSAELFDRGLSYLPEWQPLLDEPSAPMIVGYKAAFSGSGFLGDSEGSFGLTNNSATNYPLLLLRRIDNEQMRWLTPDASKPYTDTLYSVNELASGFRGPSSVTLFVNGIPGETKMVLVTRPVDLIIDKMVSPGPYYPGYPITYTLTFTNPSIGTAVGVIITDVVPVEINNPTFSSTSVISAVGNTPFTWVVEGLSRDEVGQITVSGIISSTLAEGYSITNTASISSTVLDPDTSNNEATIAVSVDQIYPTFLPCILNP
jgi:uncharacterized repeat protein (TIGR01451 family)